MKLSHALADSLLTSLDPQTYLIGELFAGAGGLALGAHEANLKGSSFKHRWVNDSDADACKTFKFNLPIKDEAVFCCDVRKLDFEELEPIDGLVFGFPCNDFSMVGNREGINGQFGGLYRWGIIGLKTKKPLFFVAENVNGLAQSGGDLNIIKQAMEAAGYDIFPHTYRFEEYGVPQARHRIIIVGFRNDLGITNFEAPQPTTKDKPLTSREALHGIPSHASNNELTNQSKTVIERLKHIKPGENAFTANIPPHLQLSLKSGATISQIYKRLKPNHPAYTVTGSGGGGTHIYHWEENRALTNRERARLQSFPDSFIFQGGKESVRKQIGMAVPPEGAKHIFAAILKVLKTKNIKSQC
jgi:DNA (cytosine-5)-methyltransferase 1